MKSRYLRMLLQKSMNKYYLDTNIILRLLLKDNKNLSTKAYNYFLEAKERKIELILIPEIVFEVEYVLRKLYKVSRKDIAIHLLSIVKTPYLTVSNKQVLIQSIGKYGQISIDLVDCYLYFLALHDNARVLSFDKDLKRI